MCVADALDVADIFADNWGLPQWHRRRPLSSHCLSTIIMMMIKMKLRERMFTTTVKYRFIRDDDDKGRVCYHLRDEINGNDIDDNDRHDDDADNYCLKMIMSLCRY